MIFETLHDSAQKGELMLVDGGFCHWHLRRDGQLTIREIISTRPGAGSQMLRRLESVPLAKSLFAKCPADLKANEWYALKGFVLEGIETTPSGRALKLWRKTMTSQARPNVGNLEVIFCANGNQRAALVALDSGMLYGAQFPGTVYLQPYMADQDWKTPNRDKYMAAIEKYHPYMATVLDWERNDQFSEVLDWATEAAQHVQEVIIIPKVSDGIGRLPETINGRTIRLGYSVPTAYGGTTIPLRDFSQWKNGVHLLGGSPERQMLIYRQLGNVKSVDTNYIAAMAIRYGQYWSPATWAKVKWWPKLQEADGIKHDNPMYECLRRSCINVMAAWRETVKRPALELPGGQLQMFAM